MSLLRPIRDTSAASIELARERARSMGFRRLLVEWVLQAGVLFVAAQITPGITVDGLLPAFIGALVIGLLNALVRPILILLTLPLTVLTAGLLSLVINAVVLVLAAPLVPGLEVDSLASAIAAAILMTVFSTLIGMLVASDQDASFYAELSRRLAADQEPREPGGEGLVIVQIDGLAAPILRNAIRVGFTPRMAGWVRSGRYRLIEWEAVPPSQTSASQAGILHGTNDNIPAFRWYEKETGRLMVSNHPADAAEIERRISDGKGLLAANGMSANNLFSGDATRTIFTMSKIQQPSQVADIDAFAQFFVDPAAFVRTIALTIGEAAKEWSQARRQRALDIQPRVHRGRNFMVLRAVSNVLLRDLNITFLINAMGRGVPIMYVDFVDYDELAHHAGPERLESLASLAGVDRALTSIERAIARAPRDYRIVVLSDHGQSQGATFLQRYGITLDQLVRDCMGGDATSLEISTRGEGWGPVNAVLAEVANRPGVAGRVTAGALRDRRAEGGVEVGSAARREAAAGASEEAEVVVGASGNLANVYFLAEPGRMSLEQIEARYPGLVARLAGHPGIGFVLVRSETLGPLAMGGAGVHHLATGSVDGQDPLEGFGALARDHLLRLDGFTHTGDLLVNSTYDPELEEVAAFEELVGSHGGFGGPQVRPFILAPADMPYDGSPVVGAPAVHRLLVGWADRLGVGPASGATESPLVAEAAGPRRAPGIRLVAAYALLLSLVWLLVGSLIIVLSAALGDEAFILAGTVLLLLGLAGIALAHGLWKRRPWARMAALAWVALGVLQGIAAVGDSAQQGLVIVAFVNLLLAALVFFYLTRRHVAAAFRRAST
jgi:uncharacterized membrane protein YvlD (DUF360 family)